MGRERTTEWVKKQLLVVLVSIFSWFLVVRETAFLELLHRRDIQLPSTVHDTGKYLLPCAESILMCRVQYKLYHVYSGNRIDCFLFCKELLTNKTILKSRAGELFSIDYLILQERRGELLYAT
ncbi:hypothetical protein P280DRAFT_325362 [Massarina eburnea CBS 473.64]|uniref:Uncharacterized protein n=1 Tax=Massarina eburnea CBS 473.64 TaxID=1395130 RepID=A0A6A6RYU2_9PLEO|nr:hypothetical protein P280DRAFT_325362 [Massarina eburnea CBS 473.64]